MAAKEFLSTLPEEMVMLALEAVELQERLDGIYWLTSFSLSILHRYSCTVFISR